MTDEVAARLSVDLPAGTVEVSADHQRPDDAWATIVVAHGAGAGYRHPFLAGFARGMRAEGVATLTFNFPYLEAGRRMPGPATHAIAAWRAAIAFAVSRAEGAPVWASRQVLRRPDGVDGGGRRRRARRCRRAGSCTWAIRCIRRATTRRCGPRICRSSARRSSSSRARTTPSSIRTRSSRRRSPRARTPRSRGSRAAGTRSR